MCVKRIVFLRGWVLNDIIYELMQVLRLTAGERLMRDYYSDEVKGLPPPVSCGQSSLQIVAYLKRLTRAFAVELDEAGYLDTLGDGDGVIVESGLDSQEDTAGIMQKQRKAAAEAFGGALRAIERGFGGTLDELDPGAMVKPLLRSFVLAFFMAFLLYRSYNPRVFKTYIKRDKIE